MGKITVNIDDEVERQTRMKIAKDGGKKGDLAKAVESGLRLWNQTNTKKRHGDDSEYIDLVITKDVLRNIRRENAGKGKQ